MAKKNKLKERLKKGTVFAAEGYLFQLEHRGYLKAGAYVPEVSLDHPEALYQLHRDFAFAGSDVQLAFTYYAHRDKLKTIGRENDLEKINKAALKIAREVAEESDALFAGNICNTGVYDPDNPKSTGEEVRRQYEEQVKWAVEEGVDYIAAETIEYLGEAQIALEVIKKAGLPSVICYGAWSEKTKDGIGWVEAAKKIEQEGADVVGFNCSRGPATMLTLLKEIRPHINIPIAALPVAYRTTPEQINFQSLKLPNGESAFTLGLEHHLCTRQEMADFAVEASKIGVEYIGICCGGEPYQVRAMLEALGRTVPASRYSPDLRQHYQWGSKKHAKKHEQNKLGVKVKPRLDK